ncbi:type II toxin-antitoxin system YafO family toxin [Glaesserella parasuis]|uniref:Uncharacterized protein n=1 Tax=Glaesserella parasuis TaxID=738 RepID=A0A6I5WKQ5_GLAPU|nr:type II toxin-antitoxin system YafO family toxin [Glaesserella parasuis]EPZ99356.1 hypothetical protein HPSMNH_1411 [Glaesserella parasuis MN-H]AIK89402.1 hypothetical protein JT17_00845 [Glaesserella parasuis]ATW45366.1 hypothetical protein A2U21_05185 [Glaesserella parasuis str. Nagasaki]AWY45456.1 hypothetical protein B4U42_05485 [Glaesserella parasuis 29755]EQA03346.1 hypothetical protein HPSNAG_0525 [Glaesserella parasuis str. Nagasaki]
MNVAYTQLFNMAFSDEEDKQFFIEQFKYWKQNGENSSYHFGKDGFYTPIQSGLRHVHLVPVINILDKINWDKHWQTGQRRTSDTCLVYVEDGSDYLLITILPEPLAHKIAAQREENHRVIMKHFRHIAEQFFYYRNIVS